MTAERQLKEWEDPDDEEFDCKELGAVSTPDKCKARRMKANIRKHNPKSKVPLTEKEMAVCGGCYDRTKNRELGYDSAAVHC